MDERVRAERFDKVDICGKALAFGGKFEMLWPDAENDFARTRGRLGHQHGRQAAVIGQNDLVALDPRRQEIHRRCADEAGDEEVARVLVDLLGAADLLDDARFHHHDPVGHRHRLDLVMGDEDHGRLQLLGQRLDLGPDLAAQLRIEIRQGFVEQEDLRIAHDGAAHGDTLALTARQCLGTTVEIGVDIEKPRRFLYLWLGFGGGHAAHLQREGHVLAHGHMRIKRVVLKHHGDVAPCGRDFVHPCLSDHQIAAVDGLKPGQHAQKRRFSAARGTDQNDELLIRDLQIEVGDDRDGTVFLDQVAHGDRGHQRSPSKDRTGFMDFPAAKSANFRGRSAKGKASSTNRA